MKKNILITGAGPNGITGRRIKDCLSRAFNILSPTSLDLDLTSTIAVDKFFSNNKIDFIIHSAVTSPSRGHDNKVNVGDEVESNLRMYFNLAKHSNDFDKMFFLGSGAEYGKSSPIILAKEHLAHSVIPSDKYGFIKHIINEHAIESNNIYNLRLFGTINPYERPTKNVISNLCAKKALSLPLTLNRNCRLSFVDIDDVANIILYAIENGLKHHDYNIIGQSLLLSDIAEMIRQLDESDTPVKFKEDGLNMEYTGDNERISNEFSNFTPIEQSLEKVFDYIRSDVSKIDPSILDNRWK